MKFTHNSYKSVPNADNRVIIEKSHELLTTQLLISHTMMPNTNVITQFTLNHSY